MTKPRARSASQSGLSLLETLIALVILGAVIAIAYGGILGSLTSQVTQEATVSSQAKMRRIVEVLSQELRSAVFGSIIDSPYRSSESDVSFLLLTGGAGYPVARYISGDTSINVVAPASGLVVNQQVLVADQQGRGVLTTIRSVGSGPNGTRRLGLSCGVPMPHTSNTLIFEVSALGVRFDEDEGMMHLQQGLGADEQPFAFDIADFRIDYVYAADGQNPIVRATPYRSGTGIPEQSFESSGDTYSLARLQVVLGVDAITRQNTTRHSLTSQIELLRTQDFALKELTSCL